MKVTAVILAAGESSRMGKLKPLLPFGESTILETVIDQIGKAGIDEIFVVVGHEGKRIQETISSKVAGTIPNEDYRSGMFSSVLCAVRHLESRSKRPDGVLVALADQPSITSVAISGLVTSFHEYPEEILVPTFKGRRGHPIIFPFSILKGATSYTGVDGLRGFRELHSESVVEVAIDEKGILIDLDTPEEYEAEKIRNAQI
ncbi:MAG: nucleotidyltransferase family protein [Planctomycetota bacterium]|nr:nucleotidyltransferase family protein [Planctomycetota bacterium]MDA1142875.1 nucleotidyltransferase family protein [Planctomycetota bacterium]